jgi:hypothetical protein
MKFPVRKNEIIRRAHFIISSLESRQSVLRHIFYSRVQRLFSRAAPVRLKPIPASRAADCDGRAENVRNRVQPANRLRCPGQNQ